MRQRSKSIPYNTPVFVPLQLRPELGQILSQLAPYNKIPVLPTRKIKGCDYVQALFDYVHVVSPARNKTVSRHGGRKSPPAIVDIFVL